MNVRPRAAPIMPSVAMNGGGPMRVTSTPFAIPITPRRVRGGNAEQDRPAALDDRHAPDNARRSGDRADGEVDPGGKNHQCLTHGDDRHHRDLHTDVENVVEVGNRGRRWRALCRRRSRHQPRTLRDDVVQSLANRGGRFHGQAGLEVRRRWCSCSLLSLGAGRQWTRRSWEKSDRLTSPAIRRSRSTRMRSHMLISSGR